MKIHYIHLDSVDSTNNRAKEHAGQLRPFTCITAKEQTAGRGRFQRHWVSPAGQNIYASLYFTVPLGSGYLCNIGQIMAYSVAKILRDKGFEALIKWPNDVLINTKKIGGVLTETMTQGEHIGVIVGIGLNVNMPPETLKSIDQPATSLLELSGRTWDIKQLTEAVMNQFLHDFEILQKEGFAPFQASFEKLLAYKGQEIMCRDGTQTLKGICHSISMDGRLLLLLPSGEVKTLMSGELN